MPKGKKGFQKGNKVAKGKHKKTIEREIALQVMREKILEKWEPLIEKKIELAEGVFAIKPVKVNGVVVDVKVYKEKPDRQSLEYIFSIVIGKPKESLDVTTGGKSIEILKINDDRFSKFVRRKAKELDIKKGGN